MADVDNSQSPISQESAYQPISERGMKEWETGFFDAENARKELAKAIIMLDYPLSIMDHLGFRRFMAAL